MAYIRSKTLRWTHSSDPDVVGYKVRWAVPPAVINYDPSVNPGFNVGYVTQASLPLPGMPEIDGQLTIGVTAYDDVGNESDPVEGVFPFDFIPPAPPKDLVVV